MLSAPKLIHLFKLIAPFFFNSCIPSLEEECESSLCTTALRAKNMELHRDMKRLTAVFEKLNTYISLLALPSKCHSASVGS